MYALLVETAVAVLLPYIKYEVHNISEENLHEI